MPTLDRRSVRYARRDRYRGAGHGEWRAQKGEGGMRFTGLRWLISPYSVALC
jgi:hypothetical protein